MLKLFIQFTIITVLFIGIGYFSNLKHLLRVIAKKMSNITVEFHQKYYRVFIIVLSSIAVVSFFGFLLNFLLNEFTSYIFTTNLTDFYTLNRNVFSFNSEIQNPLKWEALIKGLFISPGIDLVTIFFLYLSLSHFMLLVNQKHQNFFSRDDLWLYFLLSIAIYMFGSNLIDIQNVKSNITQGSMILLQSIGNLKFVLGYFLVLLIQHKKTEKINTLISGKISDELFHKKRIIPIVLCYLLFVFTELPNYFGITSLANHYLIPILFCVLVVTISLYIFIFKNYVNPLGSSIMVMDFDLPVRSVSSKIKFNKKWLYIFPLLIIIIFLYKPQLIFFTLFSIFVFTVILISVFTVSIFGFSILYLIAAIVGSLRSKTWNWNLNISKKSLNYEYQFIKHLCFSHKLTLLPIGILFSTLFFLFTVNPKSFNIPTAHHISSTVLTSDYHYLNRLDTLKTDLTIAVNADSIPNKLIKYLSAQEDRAFPKQNEVLINFFNISNLANWNGVNFKIIFGSNLNQQATKNLAFPGKNFPYQFYRKLKEISSSYMLSFHSKKEILSAYLSISGFEASKGYKGIYAASIFIFGRDLNELNDLELVYLLTTLRNANGIEVNGDFINYKDTPEHTQVIKNHLIKKAKRWLESRLISNEDYLTIQRGNLNFQKKKSSTICSNGTSLYLKANFPITEQDSSLHFITFLKSDIQKAFQKASIDFKEQFKKELSIENHYLYFAGIAFDPKKGQVIGHFGGNDMVLSDYTNFGSGFEIASTIKPFVYLEGLEQGMSANRLFFDGPLKGVSYTPRNIGRGFSRKWMGLSEALGRSTNPPAVQAGNNSIYRSIERKFHQMGISKSPETLINDSYALGTKQLTLFELAQIYQVLFNDGVYKNLQLTEKIYNPYTFKSNLVKETKELQLFSSNHCSTILTGLSSTFNKTYGTGYTLKSILPSRNNYVGKTGTASNSAHGYTIIYNGEIAILAWASYGKTLNNGRVDFKNSLPLPHQSGGKTAGLFAALTFKHLNDL